MSCEQMLVNSNKYRGELLASCSSHHISTRVCTHLRTLAYACTPSPSCGYEIITWGAISLDQKWSAVSSPQFPAFTVTDCGNDMLHLNPHHNNNYCKTHDTPRS